MRIEIQTDIRKSLLLTRETIQSVEILSFSPDELSAYLHEQQERNPLLKVDFLQPEGRGAVAVVSKSEAGFSEIATGTSRTPHARDDRHGRDKRNLSTISGRADGGDFDLLNTLVHKVNLREHLQQQLPMLRLGGSDHHIALQIIGSLEPDGYLRRPIWEIADTLAVAECAVERALAAVQLLEPSGIAARDLRECLTLQLRDRGEILPEMSALLANLDLLQKGEVQRLCRFCGVDRAGLTDLLAALRELDPRPGLVFEVEPLQLALPDILVSESELGELTISLNPALLPKVLIDRTYVARLSKGGGSPEAEDYLRDCLRAANSLIRNLDQRAQTTLKIASAIANYQKAYFSKGASALRPLSQKEVAKLVGVHESTVSRAIANKHISSAQGLVAVKYLLPEALTSRDGAEDMAATRIRDRISTLVMAETPGNILSDDAIAEALAAEGIEIARRTVAKYRMILKIPSSADRRRSLRTQMLV